MRNKFVCLVLSAVIAVLISGCGQTSETEESGNADFVSEVTCHGESIPQKEDKQYSVTSETETYRGFVIDNVLHFESNGDIHYNVYIPESYDGSRPYALYFTLPGYEGLYFQGAAQNLKSEAFGFEA